jgi:hypothetical protein
MTTLCNMLYYIIQTLLLCLKQDRRHYADNLLYYMNIVVMFETRHYAYYLLVTTLCNVLHEQSSCLKKRHYALVSLSEAYDNIVIY